MPITHTHESVILAHFSETLPYDYEVASIAHIKDKDNAIMKMFVATVVHTSPFEDTPTVEVETIQVILDASTSDVLSSQRIALHNL